MGRAEGVVHVEVAPLGELAREPGVVLRLARVEARVLEDAEPVVGQQGEQPIFYRLNGEVGIGLPGPAEVRADGDLGGAAPEQELERRQRGADPRVVGDPTVLERDVEVGANEHPLPGDVGVPD